MKPLSRLLTLDSNVLIAAIKEDEPYSEKCVQILNKVPDDFILAEPTIIYQEVCGTLARKVGIEIAEHARKQLDKIIHPKLLVHCTKAFCTSAYPLCAEYDIYAIDAIYLKVAIDNHAILASLDKKDFIEKLKNKKLPIEAYHVSYFPY
jgi:predicted nucleic acid-binding protein